MDSENSRRQFLQRSVVAAGVAPLLGGPVSAATDLPKTLRIESDGGGFAAYEVTVSGDLRQRDGGDRVSGSRAAGNVGPERGADTFRYSGEITGLVLAGPATVARDGTRVNPSSFPRPAGSLASGDFDAGSGTDRLRIESDGGGVAAYEFAAGGSVRQRDDGDTVAESRAVGHVGPEGGADEFDVDGPITAFALAGPATVSLNGSEVTPSRSSPTVSRGGPKQTVAVRPDTRMLFETAVSDYPGDYVTAEWYVDGERRVGPDLFYNNLGSGSRATFTHRFESAGTHRVRSEVYREGEASREGDDPIDAVEWTVEVGSDGHRAPIVECENPDASILRTAYETTENVEFEVAATDPDGELDRVVWWIPQADDVHAVSSVEGDYDTASVTYDIDPGLPFGAYAIDRRGAISQFRGWRIERK
ncbi:hypothetical protein M0R89_19815 (plasmid) [Halorussus limi]|uniref:PKD domain-containing protein n=1 Tax=Halorussus limi TaxID=2938695 RepID=A0A8U0HZG4_9EURY|nr:hypothetical protein [Halorussus limi]UPV76410.1 hypothetical protein M0R89_19815 [Halorussus limi]